MELSVNVLLLFDAYVPKALGSLFGGFGRDVGVAFMGVGLGDAQGEEREGKEFENLRCGAGVGDGRQEGVFLLRGGGVGGGFDGSEGTFHC